MLYPNLSVNDAGHLTVAGHDTTELAARYGTPLMILDEAVIRSRCRTYKGALERFCPAGSLPAFASKALCFKRIYEIMAEEGMGIDVVSSGDLYTAKAAGFPLERAFFHGTNKTDRDIRFAMDSGLGYFVCDNAAELDAIEAEAARRGVRQKILLRLTPGIDPHTHAKINTGKVDSKFGAAIETGQAEALVCAALGKAHIDLRGYHCHIGSQIFEHGPFCDAARIMLAFTADMARRHGYLAELLNLGGGMAVPYVEGDPAIDYVANIAAIGALVEEVCTGHGIKAPAILMEPGRSIVADAGLTLYTVGSTKTIPGFRNYVSIDGGMTDNPRYTLYQSAYTVLAAGRMKDTPAGEYTVAGCCCESGDLIQENVPLPALSRGDLLCVLTTGAYNFSMASNYNRVPRPAVVMLGKNGPYEAVRRESWEDLVRNDC
ncbi:MAG: diaminopimelate decarboxylase [Oscillospiraceae bacterium]|nr:diaminopimelate decarboxylase [Oscillospiraceae bacterium]